MEAEALNPAFGVLATDAAVDATTDEQLALRAREQYRLSGIPEIAADALVSAHLQRDERVLYMREAAVIRRVDVEGGARAVLLAEGPLYITDRRLLHFGARPEAIQLADIDELSMADDRILVTLTGSRGLTLDVDDPHQLRVLIAAAKAALRASGQ